MEKAKVIPVQEKHIEIALEKYQGTVDKDLNAILEKAKLPYVPYRLRDGRYLLVNSVLNRGFVYASSEHVYSSLILDTESH